MLVRLARQSDLLAGQMVEKESHGIKLLLIRHPHTGEVSVMDAHCFHMGAALVGGDIEDLGDNHMCVVCPAHRYKIDVNSGCVVDTDLCGNCRVSPDQKQRIYKVHSDSDYIWVNIPEAKAPSLPSDYYNQNTFTTVQQQEHQQAAAPQARGYGLFGPPAAAGQMSSGGLAPAVAPLQPYAGTTAWPVVQQQQQQQEAQRDSMIEPPLVLSQEAVQMMETQTDGPPAAAAPTQPVSRITNSFPAARMDAPHVARRKAATAAILKRSYQPPVATVQVQAPPASAPQSTAVNGGPPLNKQKTLFESWGMTASAQTTAAAAGGPQGMDMN